MIKIKAFLQEIQRFKLIPDNLNDIRSYRQQLFQLEMAARSATERLPYMDQAEDTERAAKSILKGIQHLITASGVYVPGDSDFRARNMDGRYLEQIKSHLSEVPTLHKADINETFKGSLLNALAEKESAMNRFLVLIAESISERKRNRLPLKSVALVYQYLDKHITPQNRDAIARGFDWCNPESGKGLYDDFRETMKKKDRCGILEGVRGTKKRVNNLNKAVTYLKEFHPSNRQAISKAEEEYNLLVKCYNQSRYE